ncbi:hypothetical protein ACVWYQ_003368 [Bradyrhizobium sp. USDA 3397]
MQLRSALSDGRRPSGHFRNSICAINESMKYFDKDHAAAKDVHRRTLLCFGH